MNNGKESDSKEKNFKTKQSEREEFLVKEVRR